MKNKIYIFLILSLIALSCDDNFLDKKPDKSLVVPKSLADFQRLLDNAEQVMNVTPGVGMISSDDSFTTPEGWQSLFTATERNAYRWVADIFEGELYGDWDKPYQQIFYANVVLDGIDAVSITPSNRAQWEAVKGSALFFRAHAYYQLASLFCQPYTQATGSSAIGLPLRLTADINEVSVRASLEQTYERIITDLEEAEKLLPPSSQHKTRPTREAVDGLLARIYLEMDQFEAAEQHASMALEMNDYLMNYNDLSVEESLPIPRMNDETIFYASGVTYGYMYRSTTYVDTLLYASFEEDDLRKEIFFAYQAPNRYSFKGHYTGSSIVFGGISRNEIYLIRTECRARLGDSSGAMEDLNALLSMRWKKDTFEPVEETDPVNALNLILTERRKELLFRGTRWADLRRLNREAAHAKTLVRTLGDQTFTLAPNDVRYTLPIPIQEIRISGIEQNPR